MLCIGNIIFSSRIELQFSGETLLIMSMNFCELFFRYKSKTSIPAVVPGMTPGGNINKNGRTKQTGPPGKDTEYYV